MSSTFRTHDGMHSEKSVISLSSGVCALQPRLAPNRWGQELSPTQPSLRSPTAIMITCSNSPVLGGGIPQSLRRWLTAHHRDFRALSVARPQNSVEAE